MEALLIIICCLMATTKILAQGRFAKNMAKTPSDALLFNGLIFSTGAIILLPIFGGSASVSGIVAGILVGILNVIFQMVYVCAFSCGPVSLTAMIATTSMVVPVIVSAILYQEPLSFSRVIGIVITVIALYFTTDKVKKGSIQLKWMLLALLTFVSYAASSVTQKIYLKSFADANTSSFVAIHFTVSAIVSLAVYGILWARGKKCSYQIGKRVVGTAVFIGTVLGVFSLIYTYSLAVMDATVFLPIFNGAQTVLVTVCGAWFMRERLTRRQKISIALGVTAIVLMSLS